MTVPLDRQKNIADVAPRVRLELGLGSAATEGVDSFATAAQGAKADSAIQAADLAAYATKDEVEGAAAGNIAAATWAQLVATPGTRVGQPGSVSSSDTGTHTDPVVGGTVPNGGEYRWSGSAWQRTGDSPSVYQQESVTDTRPGASMIVGAFGLGGQSIYLDNTRNLNNLGNQSALYHWWGAYEMPVNAPGDFCTMLHINHSIIANTQIAFRLNGEIYYRVVANGVSPDWNRIDGDVSGPAVSVDNAPVGFSGTSGRSIKQLTGPVAALHAVTGAENKLAYFTGAAAMATTDLTAFARTVLDDTTGAAMFATMGATFSGNATAGAAKLPSGLELKWGTSTSSLSDYRLLFPVAFANDCFVALPVNTFDYSGAGDRFIGVSTSNIDKNGFDIRARNITNGGGVAGQANVPVRWLAVGW